MITVKGKMTDHGTNIHISAKLKDMYLKREEGGFVNYIDKIYIADATKLSTFCDLGDDNEYETSAYEKVYDASTKPRKTTVYFFELAPLIIVPSDVVDGSDDIKWGSRIMPQVSFDTYKESRYSRRTDPSLFYNSDYSKYLYQHYVDGEYVEDLCKDADDKVMNGAITDGFTDATITFDSLMRYVYDYGEEKGNYAILRFKFTYKKLSDLSIEIDEDEIEKYANVEIDVPIHGNLEGCIEKIENREVVYKNLVNTIKIDQFKERMMAVMVVPRKRPDVDCPVKNYGFKLVPDMEHIHMMIMNQLSEVEKRCNVPDFLIDLILKMEYLMSAIESKMYDMAVKIWNMIFKRERKIVDRCGNRGYIEHEHIHEFKHNCNCHGNNNF